jgi:hypothetical protein
MQGFNWDNFKNAYSGTLRLTFSLSPSVCLVKESFSLGKLRKSSKPNTAIRQAI